MVIDVISIFTWCKKLFLSVYSSIIFYTSISLPDITGLEFDKVAYFVPLVGVMIGGVLGLGDRIIDYVGMPVLTRSALVVGGWIFITGGLHLDGVMDSADGLAVLDKEKRLQVMADSATGAFGAMAGVMIILLKTVALADLTENRWLILMAACGWGRWGQQLAIAFYPYLKPTGKGAFHKQAISSYWDVLPGLLLMLSLSGVGIVVNQYQNQHQFIFAVIFGFIMAIAGCVPAYLTAAWFNRQLGGHTGDTYGAVVEWTEALFLCVMSCL
jgi:adenosylcobinamide-GDP ribazoletransferase